MKGDRRRWWLAWAATAVLLALCLCPSAWLPHKKEGSGGLPHLDKVVHFGMFATFAGLWLWAAPTASVLSTRPRTWRWRGRVLAAALALAVGTELAQGLPAINRDPDPLDALADAVGAFAAAGLMAVVGRAREPEGPETTDGG